MTAAAAEIDADPGPVRTAAVMVASIAAFLLASLAWALLAELDVAVQARGAVVAPGHVQEVQSLEGGIVEQVAVRPGQAVRRGDVVARLDSTQAGAELGETRHQWLGATVAKARLDALLSGGQARFDPAWRQEAPELIERETVLWLDARRELAAALDAAGEVIRRRQGELAEAEARLQAQAGALKVAEEAFAIEDKLWRQGATARADFLSAEQRVLGQRAELDATRQSLPRLQAALAESRASASEIEARTRAQWGAQRTESQTRAAALASTLGGRTDRSQRRTVVAPMDGIVNRVLVNTVGGVVAPGKAIVEIVPPDSGLTMALRVRPSDIGFIHAGQRAHVRVLAYDTSTYGRMEGQVSLVAADAVPDEHGESYFEVQVTAEPGQLKLHDRALPVTPGMSVEVGIVTGRRTVAQYLLKPVLRGLQNSLQER